jgi:hypothetical protein
VPWDGSLSGAGLPTAAGASRLGGHRAESEAAGELPESEAPGSGPSSAAAGPLGDLAARGWPPQPQLRQLSSLPRHRATTAAALLLGLAAQKQAFFNGLLVSNVVNGMQAIRGYIHASAHRPIAGCLTAMLLIAVSSQPHQLHPPVVPPAARLAPPPAAAPGHGCAGRSAHRQAPAAAGRSSRRSPAPLCTGWWMSSWS